MQCVDAFLYAHVRLLYWKLLPSMDIIAFQFYILTFFPHLNSAVRYEKFDFVNELKLWQLD